MTKKKISKKTEYDTADNTKTQNRFVDNSANVYPASCWLISCGADKSGAEVREN